MACASLPQDCFVHTLEPHYNWRNHYMAEDDPLSPFYGREYSEFEYSQRIYNYVIHPQWDGFGSATLYLKLLFVDYSGGFAIIELLGEWNDLLGNDIMFLKRDMAELLMQHGVDKFILIGENVLNFHYSDEEYYAEWAEEIPDGWVALVNFRKHVTDEMRRARITDHLLLDERLSDLDWRAATPHQVCDIVAAIVGRRLS
jgi:hypothetical protein